MSERDKATDATRGPTLRRDWRFYAGMTALVLAVILPLGAFIVPMLGLPLAQSALLVGVLVAGGPEVLCIAAVALLGKETFQYLAHHAKLALRRAVIDRPASKARYYVGLAIILLSWLPAYIYAYAPAGRKRAHLHSRRHGPGLRRERFPHGWRVLGKGQAHLHLRRQSVGGKGAWHNASPNQRSSVPPCLCVGGRCERARNAWANN